MTALAARALAPPWDDVGLIDPSGGEVNLIVVPPFEGAVLNVLLTDVPSLDAPRLEVTVVVAALLVELALLDVELVDVVLPKAAQLEKFWPPNSVRTFDKSAK